MQPVFFWVIERGEDIAMSIDHFQLPKNCSNSLQQLHVENASQQAFFSSLKNEPHLFIELFESACASRKWVKNNAEPFKALVTEITGWKESPSCSVELRSKIGFVCERTLLSPRSFRKNGVKNFLHPLFRLHWKLLSLEKALHLLFIRYRDLATPLAEQACDFIRNETGQRIKWNKNGPLTITVKSFNDQTNRLLEFISALDSEQKSRIKIHFHFKLNQGVKKVDLDIMLKKYGREADSLTLNDYSIKQRHFDKLIGYCPKLSRLSISWSKITNLDVLRGLPNLTELNCSWGKHLNRIPKLPHLKKLDCEGCKNLKKLPIFIGLRELKCGYCYSLAKLPELPLLTTLNCSHCSFAALPKLPLLKTLKCRSCNKLEAITELPSLTTLDCAVCPSLHTLSELPLLMTLRCFECDSIKSLTKLPSLITLDCCDCESIRSFSELPSLMTLKCKNCDVIKTLSGLPSLMTLDCSGCYTLNRLSELPSLKTLDCRYCCDFPLKEKYEFLRGIYSIDSTRSLQLASSLDIQEKHLEFYIQFGESNEKMEEEDFFRAFFENLKLYELIVSKKLKEVMKYSLEELEEFLDGVMGENLVENRHTDVFFGNRDLAMLLIKLYPPAFIENLSLYPAQYHLNNGIFYLSLIPHMLLYDPDAIIEILSKFPIASFHKINVHYYGSPGIDEDGLARQLVADTIRGLFTHSEVLQFEKLENGRMRPKAKDNGHASMIELKYYRTLGSFFGFALRKQYPIGLCFSEKLLHLISLFSESDLVNPFSEFEHALLNKGNEEFISFVKELTEIEDPGQKTLFEIMNTLVASKESEVIKAVAREFAISTCHDALSHILEELDRCDSDGSELIAKIRQLARDDWLMSNRGYLEIAHALAWGMKNLLPYEIDDIIIHKWEMLKFVSTEQFSRQLQGSLSIASIKSFIAISPEESQEAEMVKEWIDRWLDDHANDRLALANFVQTITGAPAILQPIVFNIQQGEGEHSVVSGLSIHTCSCLVNLPSQINEEGFRESLDSFARGEHLEFTKA